MISDKNKEVMRKIYSARLKLEEEEAKKLEEDAKKIEENIQSSLDKKAADEKIKKKILAAEARLRRKLSSEKKFPTRFMDQWKWCMYERGKEPVKIRTIKRKRKKIGGITKQIKIVNVSIETDYEKTEFKIITVDGKRIEQ